MPSSHKWGQVLTCQDIHSLCLSTVTSCFALTPLRLTVKHMVLHENIWIVGYPSTENWALCLGQSSVSCVRKACLTTVPTQRMHWLQVLTQEVAIDFISQKMTPSKSSWEMKSTNTDIWRIYCTKDRVRDPGKAIWEQIGYQLDLQLKVLDFGLLFSFADSLFIRKIMGEFRHQGEEVMLQSTTTWGFLEAGCLSSTHVLWKKWSNFGKTLDRCYITGIPLGTEWKQNNLLSLKKKS